MHLTHRLSLLLYSQMTISAYSSEIQTLNSICVGNRIRQYIDGRVVVRSDDEAINKTAAFNLADCEIVIGRKPYRMGPIASMWRNK